jgi:arylsulfatase A-like enzyme
MYNDVWDKELYSWPAYSKLDPEFDDEKTVEHVRKQYFGTLTMADEYLGKFLDVMDTYDMWKDTSVILTTDHGHLLGEHGFWAKNYTRDYQELVHIPLFIYHPDAEIGVEKTLTSAVDIAPTVSELHDAGTIPNAHGCSLHPLLKNETESAVSKREAVLYGYFQKDMNITDGTHTYHRQSRKDSKVFHYTLNVSNFSGFHSKEKIQKAEFGNFLPYADMPMLKIENGTNRPADAPDGDVLFNVTEDPAQEKEVTDIDLHNKMERMLSDELMNCGAQDWQYERLGLSKD